MEPLPSSKPQTPIPTTPSSNTLTSPRPLMETPHPSINLYGPVNCLYGPLQDLTETPTLLQTVTDINHLYGTLYSIADISKQVSEGQKKWRQRVDVTSTNDINDYIDFKVLEYGHYKLINNNLWEQYQEDFIDFTEAIFKACSPITIRKL